MPRLERKEQNPSRFRQFTLWFKPSWKMSFREYVDHYHRLKPEVREELRELTDSGKPAEKRFAYMVKHYRKLYGPLDNIIDHNALVEGLRALNLPKSARVVSYGAGSMHHECFLAKEFPQIAEVIGIEPLAEMRGKTKRTAANILGLRESRKIRNIDGTFENSHGVPLHYADVIITNEAFHHVKDPRLALANMLSKLNDTGGIVIVYRPKYKTNPPSPAQISRMLGGMGFATVRNVAVKTDSEVPSNNIQLIVARKK